VAVRVEFFGIARERAGVAAIDVDACTLGDALRAAAAQLPGFGQACLENCRLQPGYLANVNGLAFTADPKMPLQDGDAVLILSADAGG
jgi:molybdopterin converting factor small subunit